MQELIDRVKNQDRKAQEILYKKYADRFFYVCFRYVSNENDAAEVLNSSFYKIFLNIESFNYINNKAFEGWMYKILINESLMFLRQSCRNLVSIEIENAQLYSYGVEDENISEEDCFKLLQMLPEGYRTVFNLYAIEGYSHQEISEMFDISESTSRSQLCRARQLLRSIIKKEI